jgi:hypothetical protein
MKPKTTASVARNRALAVRTGRMFDIYSRLQFLPAGWTKFNVSLTIGPRTSPVTYDAQAHSCYGVAKGLNSKAAGERAFGNRVLSPFSMMVAACAAQAIDLDHAPCCMSTYKFPWTRSYDVPCRRSSQVSRGCWGAGFLFCSSRMGGGDSCIDIF